MAQIVMILGESGSGKTASLRNFKTGEAFVFEVAGKPLPFKCPWAGKYVMNRPSYKQIEETMLRAAQNKDNETRAFVIDDSQYLMAFESFASVNETGFGKFTRMACNFKNLIDFCNMRLPDDFIVYFLHHTQTDDYGVKRAKTIGKMLDSQLTVEGMFTTVLTAGVEQGRYFFLTHNLDGTTTTKSPIGMFDKDEIDNDLSYVDKTIRDYYGIKKAEVQKAEVQKAEEPKKEESK